MYSIELQTMPLAADKTGFHLKIFHFDIRGKLSIIRCDKYILMPKYLFNFTWRDLPISPTRVRNCNYIFIHLNSAGGKFCKDNLYVSNLRLCSDNVADFFLFIVKFMMSNFV